MISTNSIIQKYIEKKKINLKLFKNRLDLLNPEKKLIIIYVLIKTFYYMIIKVN